MGPGLLHHVSTCSSSHHDYAARQHLPWLAAYPSPSSPVYAYFGVAWWQRGFLGRELDRGEGGRAQMTPGILTRRPLLTFQPQLVNPTLDYQGGVVRCGVAWPDAVIKSLISGAGMGGGKCPVLSLLRAAATLQVCGYIPGLQVSSRPWSLHCKHLGRLMRARYWSSF